MVPVSSASSSCSRLVTEQRAQRPWCNRPGWPQLGQLRQAPSGRVHNEHNGSSIVPPRSRACCPQPAQRIQRCVHAKHQGLSVAFDTTQAAVRPQIAHVSTARGTHLPQSGPPGVRTWTGRRRPHPTHVSWLVGSVIKQWGHSGRPCVSRVAASRTVPHRPQGWARDLAVQLRHSHLPSIRLCRWMIRPQRGQGGRTIALAWALHRASIRRRTDGVGASAPVPVSSSGRCANAQAS